MTSPRTRAALVACCWTALAAGPARAADPAPLVAVRCGRLLDGRRPTPAEDVTILVEGDRIRQVGRGLATPTGATVIDLGRSTCLPGLIDSHTHILLQGDITSAEYEDQLLKESIPYRTIRATMAARTALDHGFTTMRDLETEGAMYADVDVRNAINRGVIPGPRLFVATRAMAPTGTYPLLGFSWELRVPEGVQIADGVDGVRQAVREQVKYGADWIKYYSDRRYYMKDGALHSWVNFTDEEAHAIVDGGPSPRAQGRRPRHRPRRDPLRAERGRGHHRARPRPRRRDHGHHGEARRLLVPDHLRRRLRG